MFVAVGVRTAGGMDLLLRAALLTGAGHPSRGSAAGFDPTLSGSGSLSILGGFCKPADGFLWG